MRAGRSRGQDIRDLDDRLLDEMEAFFIDDNRVNGRSFRVLEARGPQAARRTARAAERAASKGGRPA